jgi:hypothetical protein
MARFYGRRRDGNHWTIIKAFEKLNASVIDVSQTPCGFDILVGYGGLCMPVEIKNPDADNWKKRAKGKRTAEKLLTPAEKKVHSTWTGGKRLVMDLNDVAETVNTLRRWHAAIALHLVNSCAPTAKAS